MEERGERGAPLGEVREKLEALVEATRSIDRILLEDGDVDELLDDLRPQVLAILDGGCAMIEELSSFEEDPDDLGEASSGDWFAFEASEEPELTTDTPGLEGPSVVDLLFVARAELGQYRDELVQLHGASPRIEVSAALARALGSTAKAAIHIERTYARREGLEPRLHRFAGTELALKARVAYTTMRRTLQRGPEPAPKPTFPEVYARLRFGLRCIEALMHEEVYPHLRFSDRSQLEQLRYRILDWMDVHPDEVNVYAGNHIWDDLNQFSELLRAINNRQELREHDAHLVTEALEAMTWLVDDQLTDELRGQLELLRGRFDPFDDLLDATAATSIEAWREGLERLAVILR